MGELIFTSGSQTLVEVAPYVLAAAIPADAAFKPLFVAEQFALNFNEEEERKSQYGQNGQSTVVYKERTSELDLSETDYKIDDPACVIVRDAFLASPKNPVYVRCWPNGKGVDKEVFEGPAYPVWSLKGENTGYLRTPVKFSFIGQPVRDLGE